MDASAPPLAINDTIAALLARGRETLNPSPSARLDAELLLAHVLDRPRTFLYAHPEQVLDADRIAAFEKHLRRRAAHEPVAYITGEREFWSLSLHISPDVLVPRPETELLVELALARLAGRNNIRIADLGTGSGAIAVALATELPGAHIVATDSSAAALAVATRNIERHCPGRVELRAGYWLQPLQNERFDLIVSNPPYIKADDPVFHEKELQHEPRRALAAGDDGMEDLRTIIMTAGSCMKPGAWLMLEHGADQAQAVRALFEDHGYRSIVSHRDTAGLPRVTCGEAGPPASSGKQSTADR